MRRYETIVILEPDISEEQRQPLYDKLGEFITRHNGLLVTLDEWGSKHLAYSIRKQNRGFYTRLEYCGNGDLVDTLENFFRINERFLKYMTVLLQQDVDIEAIEAEITAAREREAAAQAPATAAEAPVTNDEGTASGPADDSAETPDAPSADSTTSPEAPQVEASSPETVENETKQEES